MTREKFLYDLQEIMQRDEPLSLEQQLADLEEWDSLSALGVAAYFDYNFGIQLTADHLKAMKTVSDLVSSSGIKA